MSDAERSLREEMQRRLLASARRLPTAPLERLGKTAMTALRARRLLGAEAPDVEALAAMVTSIGELKGIAMKVGQLMSYVDVALPEPMRAALSALQTCSPPMAFETVERVVREDLAERAGPLLAVMDHEPVAAASIGQVHRARLTSGTVAVKVRYPDVEHAMSRDFQVARAGVAIVPLVFPGADPNAMIAELRARLIEECDYEHEAESQERFAQIYRAHPVLEVPRVHRELSGKRVLTSDWVEGKGFEAYLAAAPQKAERDRAGAALFEFYVGALFRHGIYNCDPHPGNYLFLPDGRIAMLDYGCTRAFERSFIDKLIRLTEAVHADEEARLDRALVEIGMAREGKRYDFEVARGLIRAFYGPTLHDEVRAVELGEMRSMGSLFESKRQLMKLTIPSELLFLFRIRFGLMSVLARLGARANWYRLERRCIGLQPQADAPHESLR